MRTLHFRRLTRPGVLKTIDRQLLQRFLLPFELELRARNLPLPDPAQPEQAWFAAWLRLLSSPEELPDDFMEALFAIEEMSNTHGQEQLERAVAEAGLAFEFAPDSTAADLAVLVWLAAPALLVRLHNQRCLQRLTAFEYFGTCLPAEQRPPFEPPTEERLETLAAALDPWFARHNRGQDTTQIELYQFPPEYWFLIRHGDTFARAPKVEGRKSGIIHFRPERDDVVVYSPLEDEIRLNTRTTGERELYVEKFGLFFRGRPDYFSNLATYTLEPLRSDGPDALQTEDIPAITRITLREIEIAWGGEHNEVTTRQADDLFGCSPAQFGCTGPIPERGRLARAAFDLHFAGAARPRPVQIRLPNILKLGRHCDVQAVQTWLARRGFRATREPNA